MRIGHAPILILDDEPDRFPSSIVMNDQVAFIVDRFQSIGAPEHVLKPRIKQDRDTPILHFDVEHRLGGIDLFQRVPLASLYRNRVIGNEVIFVPCIEGKELMDAWIGFASTPRTPRPR